MSDLRHEFRQIAQGLIPEGRGYLDPSLLLRFLLDLDDRLTALENPQRPLLPPPDARGEG